MPELECHSHRAASVITPASAPIQIQLHADYECHPTWASEEVGLRNFDPAELPIPAPLANAIRAWAARYEATYLRMDPLASGFASVQEEEAFDRDGWTLFAELQRALGPEHEVAYFSILSGWQRAQASSPGRGSPSTECDP